MTRGLVGLLSIAPLVVSCAAGDSKPVDRMVSIGSHSLHTVVAGTGLPAVVIDGGIATRCEEYRELQDRIAAATTVVIYDRAGYGSSEVGPPPRDSRREVEELRILLSRLSIAPPFVLVGHSLGGLNAQVFANEHPDEVAGMVLLDPPPATFILGEAYPELQSMADQMTEQWQRLADRGSQSDDPRAKAEADFFRTLASEHREMFAGSARQVSTIDSFDSLPLVVVASGVPNPAFGEIAAAYQEYWAAQSEALAARSSRGRFVFAETSSHRLHADAEDLVVDEILAMLSSLSGSRR